MSAIEPLGDFNLDPPEDPADLDLDAMNHRDARAADLAEGLTKYPAIPHYMHAGIRTYVVDHIASGDFLMALLTNNLSEAVGRADEQNRAALSDWVLLLYNDVPSACWGNPEKVAAWLQTDDCPACGGSEYDWPTACPDPCHYDRKEQRQ